MSHDEGVGVDDIEHLDFSTPETSIRMDEFGMPMFDDDAHKSLWYRLVDLCNRMADERGWDNPPAVFSISTPTQAAGDLLEAGLTSEDVLIEHEVTVGDDQVVLGFSTAFHGFTDNEMTYLWGTDAQGAGAVLVAQEVWMTPPSDMDIPVSAQRRTSDASQVEARQWRLVSQSNVSFLRTYARTGKHESVAVRTEFADGPVFSALHHMYGRVVPPFEGVEPYSVPEALSTDIAMFIVENMAGQTGAISELCNIAREGMAGRLGELSDPLRLPFTSEQVARLSNAPNTTPFEVEEFPDLMRDVMSRADIPSWQEALSNGPHDAPLFPKGFPPTSVAYRLPEELLALLAGSVYMSAQNRLPRMKNAVEPQVMQAIINFFGELNLPLPKGL